MKLLSNVSMFLVALVLVSLAGCASLFGEGWNPADATASADGSGHDGSTVGETDAGGKTDTTSADAQTDSSDAAGQDNGSSDVAVLTCPSGKAETLLNGMEKSSCCSIVEVEAYELLSTHTAVPATNCQTMDSDYCLAEFEMLAATNPESSCYRVKLWYPQDLKVKYTFSFDTCGMDKTCTHEKAGADGGKTTANLGIVKKLFSYHKTSVNGILDAKDYKLVPK